MRVEKFSNSSILDLLFSKYQDTVINWKPLGIICNDASGLEQKAFLENKQQHFVNILEFPLSEYKD